MTIQLDEPAHLLLSSAARGSGMTVEQYTTSLLHDLITTLSMIAISDIVEEKLNEQHKKMERIIRDN
jgi:hypothetical protein